MSYGGVDDVTSCDCFHHVFALARGDASDGAREIGLSRKNLVSEIQRTMHLEITHPALLATR
eukprot:3442451-Rhodomonas_salina.2